MLSCFVYLEGICTSKFVYHVHMYMHVQCTCVYPHAELDQGEQCSDNCVSRQPPPASVCREAGQAGEVLYQGEGTESGRSRQNMGRSGWKTRGHC